MNENSVVSYGFRLINFDVEGDSHGLAKQISLGAMSWEIGTHGDGLGSFECRGVGRAVCGM